MTGKNHLIFGGLCGTLVLYHEFMGGVPIIPTAVAAGTCMIGNLLPDIDVPTSAIGKIFKPISFLIQKIVGHRTFFHSLLALALLYAGMWYWSINSGNSCVMAARFGITIGYAGHLFLDMFTSRGIPLAWPFSKRCYSLFDRRSGGRFETAITVIIFCGVAGVYYAWRRFL
ncbi:MAG: metal-dependent hydrolase [Clostridiales bacterium]|nr:metal-dependent hydrolase [Clostridiales bacterium]